MKFLKSFILVILVVAISAFTLKNDDNGYKVGDKIANFKLKNIDGSMVSLTDANYKNVKGFTIIFTCNTCPYSVANEDRIIELQKKYASTYPVIAINPNDPSVVPNDSFEKMKVRALEKGFNFPYLLDEGQKVYPKFGATKTPHVYVVSKNTMKVEYIGAIDNSSRNPNKVSDKYLEKALDALIAGKKPTKTYTRAIGCTIKTK